MPFLVYNNMQCLPFGKTVRLLLN